MVLVWWIDTLDGGAAWTAGAVTSEISTGAAAVLARLVAKGASGLVWHHQRARRLGEFEQGEGAAWLANCGYYLSACLYNGSLHWSV